ncbi:hypothetical protein YC2023_101693 [Brassica napus]
MSLKLVDYESLNGDVTKFQYTIRGSLFIRKLILFLDFPKSKGCENQVNAGSVPIPVSGSSDQFLVLPETSFRGNYQR